jgi:hypothetical protein
MLNPYYFPYGFWGIPMIPIFKQTGGGGLRRGSRLNHRRVISKIQAVLFFGMSWIEKLESSQDMVMSISFIIKIGGSIPGTEPGYVNSWLLKSWP